MDYFAIWINPMLDRILANIAFISETKSCCKHPWIANDRKRYKPNTIGLSNEIDDFYTRYQKIKEKERDVRLKLLQEFTCSLREFWPNLKVGYYNYQHELNICWSLSDIYISDDWDLRPPSAILRDCLKKRKLQLPSHSFTQSTSIDIIEGGTNCCWPELLIITNLTDDNNKENPSNLVVEFPSNKHETEILERKRRKLIFYYSQVFPALARLFFILNESLIIHQLLDERRGGLSPYALILMISAYLNEVKNQKTRLNIGDKLIGFLDTYGLETKSMIIKVGPKQSSDIVSINREQEETQQSVRNVAPISIFDPVEPSINLTKHVNHYSYIKNFFNEINFKLNRIISSNSADQCNMDLDKCHHYKSYLEVLFIAPRPPRPQDIDKFNGRDFTFKLTLNQHHRQNMAVESMPCVSNNRQQVTNKSAYATAKQILIRFGYFFLFFALRNGMISLVNNWNERAKERAKDEMSALSKAMMGNDPLHKNKINTNNVEARLASSNKRLRQFEEETFDDLDFEKMFATLYLETLKAELKRNFNQDDLQEIDDEDQDNDDIYLNGDDLNINSLFEIQ